MYLYHKNMSRCFSHCIILLFLSASLPGQTDLPTFPAQIIQTFHRALVKKDKLTLDSLMANQCTYGHSNAWVENKRELLENNASGHLRYDTIQEANVQLYVAGQTVVARFEANIQGALKENAFQLRLQVAQVWILENRQWKLLARQAVKIPSAQ